MVSIPVRSLLILAVWAGRAAAPGSAVRDALADTIVVVVHDDVPGDTLDPATIRRVFLRRQRFWADRSLAAPVNLPATSPVREHFSLAVLGRSPRDMAAFWNDLYFNGVQPPPVVESQRAMLLYVARTPGAIGYVAADSLPPEPQREGYRVALRIAP